MGKIRYWSGDKIGRPTNLHENCIIYAGSNAEGRHGFGMAKIARDHWGAVYGQSRGPSGRSYLVMCKNLTPGFTDAEGRHYPKAGYRSVSKEEIVEQLVEFYDYARTHPELYFIVPYREQRNLNGYSLDEILRMFADAGPIPDNIVFHRATRPILKRLGARP
ncbi:A1S_2505 family phage non-structural protein [Ferrimonas marina]|uniref:Uncharacterized protein n=1 Tax=Ferrimonas marina TaxID=299255 RepID=A0A1M5T7H7_9GAMM|nr:hypothetical protein [Ferrimonas marina]SHH46540.1 hypothetical protein SAMN02745129_2026 [Ferrimonas marina]